MAKSLKKLVLEKACKSLSFYIENADHSEETSMDYLIESSDFNEEEIDILYTALEELDSFVDILDGKSCILSNEELDNMYSELSNLTESI